MGDVASWLDQWSPTGRAAALCVGLGLPLFVLVAIKLVAFVTGWFGVARTSARAAKRLGATARTAARLRPVRRVTSVAVTVVIPTAQIGAIGVCFLGGNYLSVVVHPDHPLRRVPEAVASVTSVGDGIDRLLHLLRVDAISGTYTLLVTVLIAMSYVYARNDGALDRIATAISAPGMVLLVPALLGLAAMAFFAVLWTGLYLIMALFGVQQDFGSIMTVIQPAFPVAAIACVIGVYVLSCRAAVFGSRTVVGAWRAQARPTA